jgi:hypothetical protein
MRRAAADQSFASVCTSASTSSRVSSTQFFESGDGHRVFGAVLQNVGDYK